MKCSASVTSSGTSFLATTTWVIYVDAPPSLSASGPTMLSPRAAGPHAHRPLLLLRLHLGAAEISPPCCHSLFLAALSSVLASPFPLSILVKSHMVVVFSLREKEATQPHMWLK